MAQADTAVGTIFRRMRKADADRDADKIRVFVVDDHPLVRQGIKTVVNQEPDLKVCGEAEDATEAAMAIAGVKPDVALVDLSLKRTDGLELIKDLRKRCPGVRVLVMSMHGESFYAQRALRAGARGYITKGEDTHRLVDGIRQVLKGQIVLNETLSSTLITQIISRSRAPTPAAAIEDRLSDRELAIFELVGNGLGTREIAERLCLSRKTVDCHRAHIKGKLGVPRAADVLKEAIKWVRCHRSTL